MKIIPLFRNSFLFSTLIFLNAYSMELDLSGANKSNKPIVKPIFNNQVESEKQSIDDLENTSGKETQNGSGKISAQSAITSEQQSPNALFKITKSTIDESMRRSSSYNEPKSKNSQSGLPRINSWANLSMATSRLLINNLPENRKRSLPILSGASVENRKSMPANCKNGWVPTVEWNKPQSDIEKIISTASEKNKNASQAANANYENLQDEHLSDKKQEFSKLATLWLKVKEVSSSLQEKIHELYALRDSAKSAHSLTQPFSKIGFESFSFQHEKSIQDQLDSLGKSIGAYEKRAKLLFRGTAILDAWIHHSWKNDLNNGTVNAFSDHCAEKMKIEKENSYVARVSKLHKLAADHTEDKDQTIAAFFERVADHEYQCMKEANQESYDKAIERSKNVFEFCSKIRSLREKIAKDLSLINDETPIASSWYVKAIECHEKNCDVIIQIVNQLMQDNTISNNLQDRSKNWEDWADRYESQAIESASLENQEAQLEEHEGIGLQKK